MKLERKDTGEIKEVLRIVVEKKNGRGEVFMSVKDLADAYKDAPEEKKYGGRVPEGGDDYFFIDDIGGITSDNWNFCIIDKERFNSGSAFWTREEAEKELKRRKAYVVLKEDTKGLKLDWEDIDARKFDVYYDYEKKTLKTEWWHVTRTSSLVFATKKDAQASIEAHPSEWKTWLGVEDGK